MPKIHNAANILIYQSVLIPLIEDGVGDSYVEFFDTVKVAFLVSL
jgi:hypothetical protein